MKIIKHLSLVALGVVFLLPSCSVEKRQHMAGYYIDWASNNKKAVRNENNRNENEKQVLTKNRTVKTGTTTEATLAVSETQAETQPMAAASLTTKTKISAKKIRSAMSTGNAESLSQRKQFKKPATIIRAFAKSARGEEPGKGLYIVLAILIPFVAVGLATDWGIEVLWNILWTLLCGIPGIIHAFVILNRKGII